MTTTPISHKAASIIAEVLGRDNTVITKASDTESVVSLEG